MNSFKKNRPTFASRTQDIQQGLQFETLEPKVMLTASPIEVPATILDSSTYVAEFNTEHLQEKFVRDYLANQPETQHLQQGNSDLRLVDVKYGLAGIYTKFVQTIDGYEVFGANITVNQGADGTVQQMFNDGHEKLNLGSLPTEPVLFNEAESIALDNVGATETFGQSRGNWAWFVDEQGKATAGWKLTVFASDPIGDYLTFVDGTTGEILFQENRIAFATGSGDVFNPNPYQTLGSGTGLDDNDDADSAVLDGQLQNVSLLGLDEGTGLLIGEFVDLATLNSTSLPDVDADEADREYNYTRDDPRFEQVNIYYSVDSMNRYFHSLGFDDDTGVANGIRDFPTLANAHWFDQDQSFYSSANDAIHFGDGGVDDGEDADIIAHEYGHAVQFNQNPSWGGGDMGAMGEGFGDYLAASFYYDNGDATYQASHAACVGEWDATSYSSTDPPCLRRVDGNKTYEDLGSGVHADGEIWSRALWDIRAAIGAATTDQLVLESHFGLPGGATMPVGAEAILLADMNLNAGANQGPIRQAFVDRLILEPLPDAGTISLDQISYNLDDTITVTVVDSNVVGDVTVEFVGSGGDIETLILPEVGGGTYEATIDTDDGTTNAGDGVLQVEIDDVVTATYTDADDGSGNSNDVTATADIKNIFKYDATGLPIVVEAGPHLSTIEVTDSGLVADLNVFLNINHTFAADLDVFLIAPDGTRVELFTDVGGGGNDFIDTTLDDDADTPIASAAAPFTGTFSPEGSLADFVDLEITGTWTLEITDDFPFDVDSGTLNAWSLCMEVAPDPNQVDLEVMAPSMVTEGDDGATDDVVFQLTLSNPSAVFVSFDYSTSTAGLAHPALEGVDFTPVSGSHTFLPGETTFQVVVPFAGDRLAEFDEQFNLELTNVAGATVPEPATTVTIVDDEVFALGQGIDFGTQTSPIVEGFLGMPATDYSVTSGFGWLPTTTSVQTAERTTGTDRTSDIALVESGQFAVDLPNGDYRVSVWIGDKDAGYADIELDVEGVVDTFSTSVGEFAVRSYRVTVADGQLTFGLAGVGAQLEVPIAAMQIFEADVFNLDFGPINDAVIETGFELGTDALYNARSGFGWRANGLSLTSTDGADPRTRDFAVTEGNLFLADLDDGFHDVTLTLGHPRLAQDSVRFWAEGQFIETISVAAGATFTKTYLVKVEQGQMDLFFKNAVGAQPNIFFNSIEIAPVSNKFGGDVGSNSRTVFDAGSFADKLNGKEFQASARESLSGSLLRAPQSLDQLIEDRSTDSDSLKPIRESSKVLVANHRVPDGKSADAKTDSSKLFDAAFDEWNQGLEQWF